MYIDKYEEHLADSAPCASRWDGFDRGDTDANLEYAGATDAELAEWETFAVSPLADASAHELALELIDRLRYSNGAEFTPPEVMRQLARLLVHVHLALDERSI
jgi:hypothetical protein